MPVLRTAKIYFSKTMRHRTLKIYIIHYIIVLKKPCDFGLCSSNKTGTKSGMRLDASSDYTFL